MLYRGSYSRLETYDETPGEDRSDGHARGSHGDGGLRPDRSDDRRPDEDDERSNEDDERPDEGRQDDRRADEDDGRTHEDDERADEDERRSDEGQTVARPTRHGPEAVPR